MELIESVQAVPENLQAFLSTILKLPYPTSECKRRCNLRKRVVTDLQTFLIFYNTCNLTFICSKGPSIVQLLPEMFVKLAH